MHTLPLIRPVQPAARMDSFARFLQPVSPPAPGNDTGVSRPSLLVRRRDRQRRRDAR
jgi:hypothetical protein